MEIVGRWHEFRDGIIRPILDAKIRTVDGDWEDVVFLLDSGADRTVLDASLFSLLAPLAAPEDQAVQLGGVGGHADCQFVQTAIAFDRGDGKEIKVNGTFAVFTNMDSSDVSILGRDVTNNFDVIYSYPQREVLLLAAPHSYTVQLPF
jgi:hypothetical protein